jgi:hypothetical protein
MLTTTTSTPPLLQQPPTGWVWLRDLDRPLIATTILMAAGLVAALVGLWLDPRTITGAPAWLKPAKFAASTAVYSATLAWVFTYLPAWRRTRAVVGWVTATVFTFEVLVIAVQAWRGTTSHFNVSTPLDAILFSTMGLAIVAQTVASVWVAVALWRQPFVDEAIGWALRIGMTMTIAGALSGGLMTRPTSAQLAEARATGRIAAAGAHTVGAPDGGAGLPIARWSTTHGDLRVGHFLGLHALQLLPLAAFALRRKRLVVVAGASYAVLFALLIWQALRGQSVIDPDMTTLIAFAAWIAATAAALRVPASYFSALSIRRAFALNS